MWQAPKRPAAKVRRSECWIWNRGRTKAGYGQLMIKGRMNYAHRVAYQLFVGPIGRNLTIDHLCRRPACFNPSHLEAVAIRENCLRGETNIAKNVAKTHCDKGHPFDEQNTLVYMGEYGPHRRCRTCHAIREWKRRHPGKKYRLEYGPYRRK